MSVSREITLRGFTDVVPPEVARYSVRHCRSGCVVDESGWEFADSNCLDWVPEFRRRLVCELRDNHRRLKHDGSSGRASGVFEVVDTGLEPIETFADLFMAGNADDGDGTLLSLEGDFSFLKGAYLEEMPAEETTPACSTEPASGNLVSRDADTMELEDIPDTAIPNTDGDVGNPQPISSYSKERSASICTMRRVRMRCKFREQSRTWRLLTSPLSPANQVFFASRPHRGSWQNRARRYHGAYPLPHDL